ncbi:MAG TPA: F0F1 ATP synthase subunit epsilon [Dongiaceae bacterium]|jgi:F-type H+-transporting ATPase subunit epsilon|nr:F0F1 ATP synthase subunit epsilon [Dongiaceae bacterium]
MRLSIADPSEILVDRDVVAVRAEDASGSFGILDGHADFLTALDASVVSWRDAAGRVGYCAVRSGILTVSGGRRVAIAAREGHVGDDLAALESMVLSRYRQQSESEQAGRTSSARLRIRAIRHMIEAFQRKPGEAGL